MDRSLKYLFTNFLTSLASLFSTLFLIMSIVFFMQIARITGFIEINFYELLKLYLFMLPRILIFTIPIAFFTSLTISLFRLSKENETTVLFTLGYSPDKIARFFIITASCFTTFLLVLSIFLIPISENLKSNFIDYKKTKAVLNIKTGEFGQKFANWLIFIDKSENINQTTIYKNVFMYTPKTQNEDEKTIIAKEAELKNENAIFALYLNDGRVYTNTEKSWHVSFFDKMVIKSTHSSNITEKKSPLQYWQQILQSQKKKKDFTIYALVSLFPLASVLFAISFGIVTYRYEKGNVYIGIFGVLFCYFALMMSLAKYPYIAIPLVFLLTFFTSNVFYNFFIKNKF